MRRKTAHAPAAHPSLFTHHSLSPMDKVRIEAKNISFAYDGPRILHDIKLCIEAGELFTLVGPSGAGKSTLLRVIAGLLTPSAGSLLINGQRVDDIPPAQRQVGVMLQNLALWPHMNVFENIAFSIPAHDLHGETVKVRVERMLTMLEIGDTREAMPAQLSAGQQQRVALARALVTEPRLLLLDDPFSNLEYELRVQMRQDLHALQRKLQITTILVSHDLEDALSLADRLAVMVQGSIRQVGSPAAVHDFPNSIEVARFVGVENFLPGVLRHPENQATEFYSSDFGSLRWPLQAPAQAGPVVLGVRPHALLLCPVDSFRDGRYSWVEGQIVTSELLGERVRYQVAVGNVLLSVKQSHFLGSPVTPPGTPVLLGFDPSWVRFFPAPESAPIVTD